MITLVWDFIKTFAPYLLALLVAYGLYFAGGQANEHKWLERQAKINAESNLILSQAEKKAADAAKTAEISAQIIGETYDKNEQVVNELTVSNRDLLNKRLHDSAAGGRCRAVSGSAKAATTGDEPIANAWELSKAVGESLIDNAQRADQIVEDCRAAQSYIISLGAL